MREHGWIRGQNLILHLRFDQGDARRFPALAAELVSLNVDVLLTSVCGAPLDAARRATSTIPIVVATCTDDLVAQGIVSSLGRPGGNITGISKLTPELAAKRLDLLKAAIPRISRVGVLWNPAYSDFAADWEALRKTAERLDIRLDSTEFRKPEEFPRAFAGLASQHLDAFIIFADVLAYVHRQEVVDLAAKYRLPGMYAFAEAVDAGGLISYAPNIPELWRRAADYVDRILRGANPADLPIEQPTKFELVINLKTAQTLGLTIPPSLVLRADRVVE
jgi:putative ABC transport system substrate-binding protein